MNYILVVLDSLRQDFIGAYGNDWVQTPNLDAFARESAVFHGLRSEALPTIPVRRALCTGRRVFPFEDCPWPKGIYNRHAGWLPLREGDVTVAEHLQERGYVTGFVADTYHMFKPAMNFHRGFHAFEWIRGQEYDQWKSGPLKGVDLSRYAKAGTDPRRLRVLTQYLKNQADRRGEEDYQAPRVFRAAMDWLEQNAEHERFFLWVDSFDPHEPWDPPRSYVDLYDPGYGGVEYIYPSGTQPSEMTEAELQHIRALYAAEVTMVDHWVGRFLRKIDGLGLRENTLVVVLSDHGKLLGERGALGMAAKDTSRELFNVPLMIRHPKREGAGRRLSGWVYNIDVTVTALNLIGVEPLPDAEGLDIWPMVRGTTDSVRDHAVCAYNIYGSVWEEDGLYIRNLEDTTEQLYDLAADPGQTMDMVRDAPERRKIMAEHLDAVLAGKA